MFSIFLGLLCGYVPSIVFGLVINKMSQKNIIFKIYWAQFCKILSFILVLLIVFKFLPIEPAIFIISVIAYLTMNFFKNLLKLIV